MIQLFFLLIAGDSGAFTQQLSVTIDDANLYTLSIAVDEVSVAFHAADFQGVPINDLTLNDLIVLDNGKKPRKIVSFEAHSGLPTRVGVMIDTSRSMLQ